MCESPALCLHVLHAFNGDHNGRLSSAALGPMSDVREKLQAVFGAAKALAFIT